MHASFPRCSVGSLILSGCALFLPRLVVVAGYDVGFSPVVYSFLGRTTCVGLLGLADVLSIFAFLNKERPAAIRLLTVFFVIGSGLIVWNRHLEKQRNMPTFEAKSFPHQN